MGDHDEIRKRSAEYDRLFQRIDETYRRRSESPEAYAAWERACSDYHRLASPIAFVETPEGRAQLRGGDPAAVERAIAFLEVDPYVFRSGYAKATIIRCIKRLRLTPEQVLRLQRVVVASVDKWDRSEFQSYCRLAAAVDSPELERQIRSRLEADDEGVSRRSRHMLGYLEQWRRSNGAG